jgi:hypothetical protein
MAGLAVMASNEKIKKIGRISRQLFPCVLAATIVGTTCDPEIVTLSILGSPSHLHNMAVVVLLVLSVFVTSLAFQRTIPVSLSVASLENKRAVLKKIFASIDDESIRSKDEAIRLLAVLCDQKDNSIQILTEARNDAIAARNDAIRTSAKTDKLHDTIVGIKNAELMNLKGRLGIRYAMEEFEQRVQSSDVYAKRSALGGKTPIREATWYTILQSNVSAIATFLIDDEDRPMTDDEVRRFVTVAQDLFRISSKHIHSSWTDRVSINSVWLTPDASKLAVAICSKLPVQFILEGDEAT